MTVLYLDLSFPQTFPSLLPSSLPFTLLTVRTNFLTTSITFIKQLYIPKGQGKNELGYIHTYPLITHYGY